MKDSLLLAVMVLIVLMGGCTSMETPEDTTQPRGDPYASGETREELEQSAENLMRRYPATIKGNWEPSFAEMEQILDDEVSNLKDLGVNTVAVVPPYRYEDGRATLASREVEYISQIVRAKKNGFSVLVAPDFVGGGSAEAGVAEQQFLSDSREIALHWADIAETYKVEYFAPQNEMDWFYDWSYYGGENPEASQAAISDWHTDLRPKLRQTFSGQLVYKFTAPDQRVAVEGYDILAVDFGHYQRGPEEFRAGVRETYALTAAHANRLNTDWMVGEFWNPYVGHDGQALYAPSGQSYKELQDDMLRIATDEYLAFEGSPQPNGFMFIAYLMDGQDVKDRPAEQVLRDFFSQL